MLWAGDSGLNVESEQEGRLVRQAQQGCRQAFGQLIMAHSGAVTAFVRKSLQCDTEVAEDLTQETLEVACKRLDRFRGDSRFRSWLIGIAVNRMRSWRRRQRFREVLGLESALDEQMASRVDCPSHQSEVASEWSRMEAAFAQLSPRQREALYLKEVADLSHEDICEALGLNLNTVKSRIHSARQALLRNFRDE